MRMLNIDQQNLVRGLQLYLTAEEAVEFRKELDGLLSNPEANEHSHISSEVMDREFFFSVITKKKLDNIESHMKLEKRFYPNNNESHNKSFERTRTRLAPLNMFYETVT